MKLRKENILIVDDDLHILEMLQRHLSSWNFHTYRAITVKEAVSILRDSRIDLLITDLKMPKIDGYELIKFVSEHYPGVPRLIITGYPSVQGSLKAIKSGAVGYLTKPFTKEELKTSVEKSLLSNNEALTKKDRRQIPSKSNAGDFKDLVGKSNALGRIFQIIERVKDNKATILITGESGTGKELIARSIHYSGKYKQQAFVPVNCGGIPESLLEAELFGYVKGAFTGADGARDGFFQAADGGTLFLDEIANSSLAVQTRLLRALQEKEVTKVGSRKSEKIDLRIIAATNGNLKEMVQKGSFREDLYYRLTVVDIELPPLRERKIDIPRLVEKFLFKYGVEYKDRLIGISPEALEIMKRYNWPGNIRELENIVQRAVIMCDGRVETENLPDALKYKIDFPDEDFLPLREQETRYLRKVLAHYGNNKTKAAEILGITRKTLREKLKQ
ncbi:sigma-54 dependent transcriptional regulator [Cytophaga sp. FL35]|uniref:sigma-54-dependent transcriptional regulator n=1 Tax=Cytophaga sp. FL35 TaxID=1904456 RepID=UPI001653744C|nr:sigma-54 dependent transcriptional regulator [Cytophaga sp. FL35]MBC7000492.1 sigma-54-dependent Fis family transcriptional regulator [Cytophaga sp. FL35]